MTRLREGRVATIPRDCTLAEAARHMNLFSVGALVIAASPESEPEGIITDRDIVKRVGDGVDAGTTTVASFAERPLVTAPEDATNAELLAVMRKAGVRRLPLLDEKGRLAAIVTLDDLLVRLGRELGDVALAIENEFRKEHPVPSAHERSL